MKGPRETDGKALEECQQRLARLEEENEALRDAAGVFGGLAERLNHALRDERRRGRDRRQERRNAAERRSPVPEQDRGGEAGDGQ